MPYGLLAVCVLAWGLPALRAQLSKATVSVTWPALHMQVLRTAPVAAKPEVYPAVYNFDWLASAGTACLFACLLAAAFSCMPPRKFLRVFAGTLRQMFLPPLTIVSVVALAFVMNYSGATATLGLALAATAGLFPFFSALLGWIGCSSPAPIPLRTRCLATCRW